jgi:uncharacterized membrane protein YfcA
VEFAWLALGLFILMAYTLEAITGFGSIIIALSLGILILPMDVVLPILVALSVPMSATIAFKNRHSINTQLLFKMILPGMLLGTVTGYLLKPYLNQDMLKLCFGLLIIWFSCREIWRMHNNHVDQSRPLWITRIITYSAGITQGLFASGGPLLVYAIAGSKIDKATFRATLSVVWCSMNTLLLTAFVLDGSLQPLLGNIALYLPLLFVAVKLGNYLHHKLDDSLFRIGIYYLLLVTGILLVGSGYII